MKRLRGCGFCDVEAAEKLLQMFTSLGLGIQILDTEHLIEIFISVNTKKSSDATYKRRCIFSVDFLHYSMYPFLGPF